MNTIRPNASLQYTQACLNQLQHRLRHKLKGWIPTPLLEEIRAAIFHFYSLGDQVLFLQKDGFTYEKMEFVSNAGNLLEISVEWSGDVDRFFERAVYDAKRIHDATELPWSLGMFANLCATRSALYLHDHGSYHELRVAFPIERSRQIWTIVPPGADSMLENAIGVILVRTTPMSSLAKIKQFNSTTGSPYQTPQAMNLFEAARKADADLLALYGGTARLEIMGDLLLKSEEVSANVHQGVSQKLMEETAINPFHTRPAPKQIPEVSPDPVATLDGIVAAHTAHRDGGLCCEVSPDLPSLELNLLSKDN